jgi:hypothetical protein
MMKVIVDHHDFGMTVGLSWNRWLIGVSIERIGNARVATFRLGPLFLHIMFP